jgi:hypothetical protein
MLQRTQLNVDRSSPAHNSRFANAEGSCFYESEMLNPSFVHLMKLVLKIPAFAKRQNVKVIRAIILMLITSLSCDGQTMVSDFQAAVQKGISVSALDSLYQSAIHENPAKAAFGGHEKELTEAYSSLLADLNSFLYRKNFLWEKSTRCFNRIYFSRNGTIDYFLFSFKPGELEPAKQQRFEKLVAEFAGNYQFPLRHSLPFAQCSPVTYPATTLTPTDQ